MPASLEHANITVTDPAATAAWMEKVFGWRIRWQGDAMAGGRTVHVGTDHHYVALYTPKICRGSAPQGYEVAGSLNHIGVVVDDLDATEEAIRALGFSTDNHSDYEPGRRFYFRDQDNIEFEVVQYS